MIEPLTPEQLEKLESAATADEEMQGIRAWDRAMNKTFKGILGGARDERRRSLVRRAKKALRDGS